MKAPDKIYVVEYLNETFYHRWQEEKYNGNYAVNHEYIRKGALLEWAKGEKMPGNSAEGKGWNLALQTLIDKLNSL